MYQETTLPMIEKVPAKKFMQVAAVTSGECNLPTTNLYGALQLKVYAFSNF